MSFKVNLTLKKKQNNGQSVSMYINKWIAFLDYFMTCPETGLNDERLVDANEIFSRILSNVLHTLSFLRSLCVFVRVCFKAF